MYDMNNRDRRAKNILYSLIAYLERKINEQNHIEIEVDYGFDTTLHRGAYAERKTNGTETITIKINGGRKEKIITPHREDDES